MTAWYRRIALLTAALVCAALSGCAANNVTNGSDENDPSPEKTEAPSTAPGGTGLPEPPGSTLSYGGETVEAGLGSYCWTSGSGAVCTDSFGTPVSRETLTVPAGSAMAFDYGGEGLDSLSVSAEQIGQGDRLERAGEGSFLLPDGRDGGYEKPIKLRTSRSGNRARVVADLPAGDYAVVAFARMPRGDAYYGFRVLVEPSGRLPETGGSELSYGPR